MTPRKGHSENPGLSVSHRLAWSLPQPPSLYLILLFQRKGLRVESGVGHTRLEMGERDVWDSQPGTRDIAQ